MGPRFPARLRPDRGRPPGARHAAVHRADRHGHGPRPARHRREARPARPSAHFVTGRPARTRLRGRRGLAATSTSSPSCRGPSTRTPRPGDHLCVEPARCESIGAFEGTAAVGGDLPRRPRHRRAVLVRRPIHGARSTRSSPPTPSVWASTRPTSARPSTISTCRARSKPIIRRSAAGRRRRGELPAPGTPRGDRKLQELSIENEYPRARRSTGSAGTTSRLDADLIELTTTRSARGGAEQGTQGRHGHEDPRRPGSSGSSRKENMAIVRSTPSPTRGACRIPRAAGPRPADRPARAGGDRQPEVRRDDLLQPGGLRRHPRPRPDGLDPRPQEPRRRPADRLRPAVPRQRDPRDPSTAGIATTAGNGSSTTRTPIDTEASREVLLCALSGVARARGEVRQDDAGAQMLVGSKSDKPRDGDWMNSRPSASSPVPSARPRADGSTLQPARGSSTPRRSTRSGRSSSSRRPGSRSQRSRAPRPSPSTCRPTSRPRSSSRPWTRQSLDSASDPGRTSRARRPLAPVRPALGAAPRPPPRLPAGTRAGPLYSIFPWSVSWFAGLHRPGQEPQRPAPIKGMGPSRLSSMATRSSRRSPRREFVIESPVPPRSTREPTCAGPAGRTPDVVLGHVHPDRGVDLAPPRPRLHAPRGRGHPRARPHGHPPPCHIGRASGKAGADRGVRPRGRRSPDGRKCGKTGARRCPTSDAGASRHGPFLAAEVFS